MFTTLVEHTTDDGEQICVGKGRHDNHMVVFDGMGGLETVIEFTDVEVDKHSIHFYYSAFMDGRGEAEVGSIERGDFGDVEEWLQEFEQGMVPA